MKSKFSRMAALLLILSLGISTVGVLPAGAATTLSQSVIKALAKEAAAESAVLLENDGVLPLKEKAKIALFGYNQKNFYPGGGGSGGMPTESKDITSVLDALKSAEKSGKLSLYQPLLSFYDKCSDEKLPDDALIASAAQNSDVAIICIGRWSEEGVDRKAEEGSYYLSKTEKQLIEKVRTKFDSVVVLLNTVGVMDLSWAVDGAKNAPNALMFIGMPGQYGAEAVPELLLGTINPSGHLSDTYADSYDAYPTSKNFGMSNTHYEEDIYVGYRYFETIPGAQSHVLYPFGYGLSYTSFSVNVDEVKCDSERAYIKATVKNIGELPGKEVVQLYFGHPVVNELGYAKKELGDYVKTRLLNPGDSETIYVSVKYADMAGYDDLGKIENGKYKSCYVLEKGDYPLYLGNNVRDAETVEKVNVKETTLVQKLSQRCVTVSQLTKRLCDDGTYEELEVRNPAPTKEAAMKTFLVADGMTKLECESFAEADGNDILVVMSGALHNTHMGGTLTYYVEAEEEGYYDIWMNTAKGDCSARNCLSLTVDGEAESDFICDVPQTGGWETYMLVSCGYVYLTKGEHELKIKLNNPGNMDYFRFKGPDTKQEEETFDLSTIKSDNLVYASKLSRVEAKNYKSTTNTSLSYNNGGYLENLHLPGTITYEIYCDTASDYKFSVGASVGNGGSENSLSVEVNGMIMNQVCLNTSSTGSWSTIGRFEAGIITLQAGLNTIIMTPGGCGNLAYYEFEYIAGGPSPTIKDLPRPAEKDVIPFGDVIKDNSKLDAYMQQMTNTDLMMLVQGRGNSSTIASITYYDLPGATVSDGPAGVRAGGTWWPVATTLACSWNEDVLYRIGIVCGYQAYANAIDFWLAPAINIHRDPLCGRNFEYYSEDPLLTGRMVSGVINGAQKNGVATTLKHFAMNNCEYDRDNNDSRVSERALREIYLEGFRIAIELSHPIAVMSSYNKINSIETSCNYDLLTGILRGEWGYDGLIMSDWFNNSYETDELNAGNNLKMPYGYIGTLCSDFMQGRISRDTLLANGTHVVKAMLQMDRFRTKYDSSYKHTTVVPDASYTYATVDRASLQEAMNRPDAPEQVETTSETSEVPQKKGCGSVMGIGGLVTITSIGLAGFTLTKKRKQQ